MEETQMRIKIINPNTTLEMTQTIDLAGQAIARDGTEIVTVSPEFGPASIESHYDEYLCAPGLIDEIRKGENENFDAYIIACFGDPALDACREITVKPVIGIAEAAMITASIISAQFSIVSLIPRTKAVTRELVIHYGFGHKLASIRSTTLHVLDVERDPEGCIQTLREAALLARDEDEAEAILLGCAGFADFAERLESELGIPVLDGVVCAVKLAEAMVELGKPTSKYITYAPPERKVYSGIFEKFGNAS